MPAQAEFDGVSGVYSVPTQNAAVGTSSEQIIAANPARVSVVISNYHATVDVYLTVGQTAVANQGLYLAAAGGVVQIGGPAGLPLSKLAINGIVESGSGTVAVQEITQ